MSSKLPVLVPKQTLITTNNTAGATASAAPAPSIRRRSKSAATILNPRMVGQIRSAYNPLSVPTVKRRSRSAAELAHGIRNVASTSTTQTRGLLQTKTPKKLMRRRSKSIAGMPARGRNGVNNSSNAVSTQASRGARLLGTNKRPINNDENDAPKPKVQKTMKSIPTWDYKSRFNRLKADYDLIKQQIGDRENVQMEYDRLKVECHLLKNENMGLIKHNEELRTWKYNHQDEVQDINAQLKIAKERQKNLECKLDESKKVIFKLETINRELYENYQDLKGNIRVFCRIRPALSHEHDKLECKFEILDEKTMTIRKSRGSVSVTGKVQDLKSEFTFDKVFPQESTQKEVFDELAQLVQSALNGFDVCVLAYGQTGSGKTFTMQGSIGDSQGMIPRTCDLIFERISEMASYGWTFVVAASFVEIYNETLKDLLEPSSTKKMDIHFNEGKGISVSNLSKALITSAQKLQEYIDITTLARKTAATNYNLHSSRSHQITKIYITATNQSEAVTLSGSLSLVDLAGSESAKQSAGDDRLAETKHINKSLATLGDVICALYNKNKYIPYRNSKLTYLLQSTLGGRSKTMMIVNVCPFEDAYNETVNSLRFASKVKEVKNVVQKNKSTC